MIPKKSFEDYEIEKYHTVLGQYRPILERSQNHPLGQFSKGLKLNYSILF